MTFSKELEAWIISSAPSFRLVATQVGSLMELDIKLKLLDLTPRRLEAGYTDRCRVIPVWRGESDNTVYSSALVNYHMRALHDYMHLTLKAEFVYEDELIVSRALCSLASAAGLNKEDVFTLSADNEGQTHYHHFTGAFPQNQRLFVESCLQLRKEGLHKGAFSCGRILTRDTIALYTNLGGT